MRKGDAVAHTDDVRVFCRAADEFVADEAADQVGRGPQGSGSPGDLIEDEQFLFCTVDVHSCEPVRRRLCRKVAGVSGPLWGAKLLKFAEVAGPEFYKRN